MTEGGGREERGRVREREKRGSGSEECKEGVKERWRKEREGEEREGGVQRRSGRKEREGVKSLVLKCRVNPHIHSLHVMFLKICQSVVVTSGRTN